MIKGIRLMRKVLAAPAFEAYRGEEVFPGEQAQTDEQLEDFIREKGGHVYHPSGTCKMGLGPDAVVDERLRVHGLRQLRVVDISIMPALISGNTNAPAMAIGEKASDMILQDAESVTETSMVKNVELELQM